MSELDKLPDLEDFPKARGLLTQANDLMMIPIDIVNGVPKRDPDSTSETADRKPYIHTRAFSYDPDEPSDLQVTVDELNRDHGPISYNVGGSRYNAGELPLHPKQIEAGFSTVFKPNWITRPKPVGDPGDEDHEDPKNRNGNDWEDENWEYRADPHKEVCTIVNITNDEVVCSSEWGNCPREYIPNAEIVASFNA